MNYNIIEICEYNFPSNWFSCDHNHFSCEWKGKFDVDAEILIRFFSLNIKNFRKLGEFLRRDEYAEDGIC